jgi:peptide/nickel transport system permease protein
VFAEPGRRVAAAFKALPKSARVALGVLGAMYLLSLAAPLIAPYEQSHQIDVVVMKDRPPTLAHPFGTDGYSRDVLSRVLYGTRVSLTVATLAMLLSAIVGTLYGLVAASSNALVDTALMRFLDALLSIPRVLLLIAVLALWSPVPLWMLVLLLGATGWFGVSRLVRAEALTIRERDFVTAARSLGASHARVMLRHMLPNVLAPVIVTTTLGIGQVVMIEAGLSFLGIGVREPQASLGTMFQVGTEAFVGTWWAAFFPGLAIVTTVLCFTIVGDGLRSALDPRQVPAMQRGPVGTSRPGTQTAT